MAKQIPDYQRFIAASRYARVVDSENRRETWEETVERLCNWWKEKYPEHFPHKLIKEAILEMEVMPSMRSLLTAGKALDRDASAAYNCSFLPIDDPKAFDEMLYILMCGTGVGFSVERQEVAKLPVVAESFHNTDTVIKVKDSRIGWGNGLRELISLLYAGYIPKWDFSALRAAGTPLKTFGGRSSGPEPLNDLFEFTIKLFKKAAGRKLTSLECHDLCCKIAESVVVGGVRRSALISLSNLSDDRMRDAKTGAWWENTPERALANNSAVYTEKPEMSVFLKEWISLYESKSGERGIFNRQAAIKKAKENGRRETDGYEYGVNPCLHPDTRIATDNGFVKISDMNFDKENYIVSDQRITENGISFDEENQHMDLEVATQVELTRKNADTYIVETTHGHTLICTANHEFITTNGRKQLKDLVSGDKILIPCSEGVFGKNGSYEEGLIFGFIAGDGFVNNVDDTGKMSAFIDVWGEDLEECDQIDQIIENLVEERKISFSDQVSTVKKKRIGGRCLGRFVQSKLGKQNISILKERVPEYVWSGTKDMVRGYLSSFFFCDGTINVAGNNKKQTVSLRLSQSNKEILQDIQILLQNFGISSKIYLRRKASERMLPDGKGGLKKYFCKDNYELIINRQGCILFLEQIGIFGRKNEVLEKALEIRGVDCRKKEKFITKIKSVTYNGISDVYCLNQPRTHSIVANGLVIGQCGEIILRPKGFCNLSEIVIRPEDDEKTLLKKVEIATIIGTFQSTITHFRYLRNAWKKNAEEERLLGVSLTGIMDNPLTSTPGKELSELLSKLRAKAVETNKKWAKILGIPVSAAITTVKPSGTVSQLVNASSGIHPRYSAFYVRTVRADKNDPLAKFLKECGIHCEDDLMKPDRTWVLSFPIASPENAITADQISALDQLKIYLDYRRYWCEHNPSITVYVREEEWMEVGAWVYKHFDEVGGISFLPYTDHSYKQAPYQPISKEKFLELSAKMPKINWDDFKENINYTDGTQELACMGGVCEI